MLPCPSKFYTDLEISMQVGDSVLFWVGGEQLAREVLQLTVHDNDSLSPSPHCGYSCGVQLLLVDVWADEPTIGDRSSKKSRR